jgi:hypothetical protein
MQEGKEGFGINLPFHEGSAVNASGEVIIHPRFGVLVFANPGNQDPQRTRITLAQPG